MSLFLKFQTEFPNLVLLSESIGKTYEGNEIQLFGLSNKSIEIENKTSMLFTGVHHAREPLSFTMNVYIMTKILFDVLHGDK